MAREIVIDLNEDTLQFEVDMDGYDGNECEKDYRQMKEFLQKEGIETEEADKKPKPPRVRKTVPQKQRAGK